MPNTCVCSRRAREWGGRCRCRRASLVSLVSSFVFSLRRRTFSCSAISTLLSAHRKRSRPKSLKRWPRRRAGRASRHGSAACWSARSESVGAPRQRRQRCSFCAHTSVAYAPAVAKVFLSLISPPFFSPPPHLHSCRAGGTGQQAAPAGRGASRAHAHQRRCCWTAPHEQRQHLCAAAARGRSAAVGARARGRHAGAGAGARGGAAAAVCRRSRKAVAAGGAPECAQVGEEGARRRRAAPEVRSTARERGLGVVRFGAGADGSIVNPPFLF